MADGGDIEKGKEDESDSVLVQQSSLLRDNSPMSSKCCIFRVPEVLRKQNEAAYAPHIVSIGPFHRGGKQFQLVENVKKWYLKCLLLRLNISLESLMKSVTEKLGKPAREYYADTFDHLEQNEFVEMLVLDGYFLIELFLKASANKPQDNEEDPIFNMSCMLEYLYHDLLLLENQLPWSVLKFLYDLIESGNPTKSRKSLSEVVLDFFRQPLDDRSIFSDPKAWSQSVADPNISSNPKAESPLEILHILDLIRTALVQGHVDLDNSSSSSHLPHRIPSAAALSEAGVKFEKGISGCILNITFEKGVFKIPPLAIDERTGPMFRNLMAYEQCYHGCKHMITSYAVLMDNLIDASKDVDLLCEKEIVANWLSDEDASKFFNELYNDTTVINFIYRGLCTKVHQYHKQTWNRWKEKLKRDYFGTPWAIISFIAAFVLLVLTFLQTIYTIHPYYNPAE